MLTEKSDNQILEVSQNDPDNSAESVRSADSTSSTRGQPAAHEDTKEGAKGALSSPWILGARPRTLPAAIVPVFVGTGVALHYGKADPIGYVLALVVALGLQIGVNYANDYSDGIRGSDENRVGPTRLVASRLVEPHKVKRAAWISFGIAMVAGLALGLMTTMWLAVAGITCIAAAWYYTGGPRPYGYRGLGELSVFLFFGLVAVVGTAYVQMREMPALSFVAAIPVGLLAVALLLVNNIRDRARDEQVGKRTLVVAIGDANARALFGACVIIPVVLGVIIGVTPDFRAVWIVVFSAFLLPRIVRPIRERATDEGLIEVLGDTGKLQILFGVLFTIGLSF